MRVFCRAAPASVSSTWFKAGDNGIPAAAMRRHKMVPGGGGARTGSFKRMATQQKKSAQRQGFKTGEFIVYPAHGVGQIVTIEEQEVAGHKLELFVIDFQKDKMRLKVPVSKAATIGMRKLSETDYVDRALKVVQGRARVKRTMWSRRAQEYDAKINSGDLISISEVVRDLYRAENQPEQSYSERQLYEAALDRMAREIAAVNRMSETEAVRLIETNLNKGPRRGAKADNEEAEQEEAA